MIIHSVIIDIGAGLKNHYQKLLSRDVGLTIHAIHPTLTLTLNEKVSKRLFVHNFVASDRDGECEVYLTDNGGVSLLPLVESNIRRWLLPPGHRWIKSAGSNTSVCKTLETFINEIRLNGNITFVNIDVQGYASQVLAGITTRRTWSVIKEINVKLHLIDYDLYSGQTKLDEVMDTLQIHDFKVVREKKRSRDQEIVMCFRNQAHVAIRWPFDKFGLGIRVL